MIHINSKEAYDEIRNKVTDRQRSIIKVVERYPNSSDRDVLNELGWHDMNMVRPRITELVQRGLLVESGARLCAITDRKCRTLKLPAFEHKGQLKMFNL